MSEEGTFKVTDRRGRGEPSPGDSPGGGSLSPDLGSSELGSLFMMFASSALVSLGAAPDPRTNEPQVDLAQAQTAIDVLLMLREKTKGNRTEQENQLLESLLYDLQIRFVRTARGNPAV